MYETADSLPYLINASPAFGWRGAGEKSIGTRIDIDHEAASVLVDKIQIKQVLVNLIRNAVDAMSTATCRLLTIRTAPDQPGFVRVTVADTGLGVVPYVAAPLFREFVCTKRSEKRSVGDVGVR